MEQFPHQVNSYSSYYRGFNTTDAIFNQEIAKYTDLYDYESTVTDGNAQSVTGEAAEAEQRSARAVKATSGVVCHPTVVW